MFGDVESDEGREAAAKKAALGVLPATTGLKEVGLTIPIVEPEQDEVTETDTC